MTLLVILEHHFIYSKGQVWVDVQCNQEFWQRYLDVFEKVTVCARMSSNPQNIDYSTLMRSDSENVEFVSLPDFVGVAGFIKNYCIIRKILVPVIKQADRILFRAPSPISIAAFPLIRASQIPYAVEFMMNPKTAYSSTSIQHPLQMIIQAAFVHHAKKVCLSANGVAYVTSTFLQKKFPCFHHKHPNDKRFFTSHYSTINLHDDDFVLKEWPSAKPNPVTLIHSSKMADYGKGHNIAIHTVKKLIDEGYSAKLILIGDGAKRDEFEECCNTLGISEHVVFTGWKSGFKGVQEELIKGHIFLFPTNAEGLPRSVIEAMASGLLCICSNVDGMTELLDPCCLLENITPDAFCDKLIDVLNHWDEFSIIRNQQFLKSQEFNIRFLSKRRSAFYKRLRELSIS